MTTFVFGQDSTKLLNNKFQFENGLYQTFEELKANQPTYNWDEVETFAHINRDKKIIQFDRSLSDICDKYLPGHLTVVAKAVPDCEFNLSDKLSLESNFLGFRMIDTSSRY